MAVAREKGKRQMESYCLIYKEFLFGKMKRSREESW